MPFLAGSGFGFWFVLGVLNGRGRRDERYTCISGSSVAAAVYLCELDVQEQLSVCAGYRERMSWTHLSEVLQVWLWRALPEDCAVRCNGRLRVLLRRLGTFRVVCIDRWDSKRDLIDTLIAACSPFVPRRIPDGRWCVDCFALCSAYPGVTLPSKIVLRVPTEVDARNLLEEGARTTAR